MTQKSESGVVLFALVALILPLMVLVGSVTRTMQGRNSGLIGEIQQEKALMAAESGLDEALFMASQGTLISGTAVTRDLGGGMSFSVMPVLLKTDGIDNDGDSLVDEADEDVFQLTIDGTYARARRRLAAYLGKLPTFPPINSAVQSARTNMEIELENNAAIRGTDTNMDGSPGAGPDLPGMSIQSPGTTADLLAELDATEQAMITGSTAAPSLDVAPVFNYTPLAVQLKNVANITLASDEYSDTTFGNGALGITNIVYRQGDLEFENVQGAGILVVDGEFEMDKNSRWDGLVIVLKKEFEIEEGSAIYGAVILENAVDEFEMEDGTTLIQYSSEAIDLATNLLPGKYVAFNGWQEISIY